MVMVCRRKDCAGCAEKEVTTEVSRSSNKFPCIFYEALHCLNVALLSAGVSYQHE